MDLKNNVKSFLKTIPRTSIFKATNSEFGLIGSIKGDFTYILTIDSNRRLTTDEIKFKEKIKRCGGNHWVIRSIDDAHHLAKTRGWI